MIGKHCLDGSWKLKLQKNISLWPKFQWPCARGPSRWAAELAGGSPPVWRLLALLPHSRIPFFYFSDIHVNDRGCGNSGLSSLDNCKKKEACLREREIHLNLPAHPTLRALSTDSPVLSVLENVFLSHLTNCSCPELTPKSSP